MEILTPLDFILAPIIFLVLWISANRTKEKRIEENSAYEYYTKGLLFKLGGALAISLIYIFYYGAGDTIQYWKSSVLLSQLFFHYPLVYLDIVFGDLSYQNFIHFGGIGYPFYYFDPNAYAVIRFTNFFAMITVQSMLGTALLVGWLSYKGVWKLYLLFTEFYPNLKKELAFAILFIPSVSFWGSGILKDTFTFGAACWFTFCFYKAFIQRKKFMGNLLMMLLLVYIIISIKPYIFVALMPGCLMWIFFKRLQVISNPILRLLSAPIIIGLTTILGIFVFSLSQTFLGAYASVDSIVNKAVVTQQDLKREYYEGNSFDIGDFEATLPGMVSKAPQAVIAGLFRPFIWEANNIVMFISGAENFIILLLSLFFFFKSGPIKFISRSFKEPLVLFSLSFSIFFAFAVGLTTSNFGSLVRYKIPAVPFFIASIFILRYLSSKEADSEDNPYGVEEDAWKPLGDDRVQPLPGNFGKDYQ